MTSGNSSPHAATCARYAQTLYRDEWLLERGVFADVRLIEKELRGCGLSFELPPGTGGEVG